MRLTHTIQTHECLRLYTISHKLCGEVAILTVGFWLTTVLTGDMDTDQRDALGKFKFRSSWSLSCMITVWVWREGERLLEHDERKTKVRDGRSERPYIMCHGTNPDGPPWQQDNWWLLAGLTCSQRLPYSTMLDRGVAHPLFPVPIVSLVTIEDLTVWTLAIVLTDRVGKV